MILNISKRYDIMDPATGVWVDAAGEYICDVGSPMAAKLGFEVQIDPE